jgi:hypothetical protein
MGSASLPHLQLSLAMAAARTTLSQLREERAQLIRRLNIIDRSMRLLSGVAETRDRVDRNPDPLLTQSRRIDGGMPVLASAKSACVPPAYAGLEGRPNPRAAIAASAGAPKRGGVPEATGRLQPIGRKRLLRPV